jgi:spermidine synthase
MKSGTMFAYFVTFSASFCIMVIELVAGRMLAPYIGQHLYSWTSIIGVCLAGISVGAWLGGWLADKFPYRATLGWFLFFSGVLALCIPILTDTICTVEWAVVSDDKVLRGMFHGDVSLMTRIVIYTTMIFFPVTMVLGMISPMVIKLVVKDLSVAGTTVGRIYSFSTIGSILGTFATGFFLIEEFGTRILVYSVAGFLMIIAPLAGGLFFSATKYVGAVLALAVIVLIGLASGFRDKYRQIRDETVDALGQPITFVKTVRNTMTDEQKRITVDNLERHEAWAKDQPPFKRFIARYFEFYHRGSKYWKESNYYTLKVSRHQDNSHRLVNYLILDNLTHSHSDPDDPEYLSDYDYLRIYEELVSWKLDRAGSTKHRQLFIGGGGYTLQRYFHHLYKKCHVDVVEIDPYVTQLAEKFMGVKHDERLVTSNEDGRLFVSNKQTSNDRYDFIFGDAFNDLSVPFHLTTKEFDQQMNNLLTKQGLVMSLVIDDVAKGMFLPSFISTMRAAFGDDNVVLILITKAKTRDELIAYLKKHQLEQYIDDLSRKTLAEVIAGWDRAKYRDQIEHLQYYKVDDLAPYLKPTNLDFVSRHDTVIVVGSKEKQDWDDFDKHLQVLRSNNEELKNKKKVVSYVIRPAALTEYLNTRTRMPNWWERLTKGPNRVPWKPIVLTDDHAPVDNLLAPLFEQRFGFQKGVKKESEDEKEFQEGVLEDVK